MKEQLAINEVTEKNVNKVANDPRYKQIQEQLAEKSKEQQNIEQVKPIDTEDKVELNKSLFNWKKNKDGDFEIKAQTNLSSIEKPNEIKYSAEKILSVLGYKIDLTSRVESLKEEYFKTFIETKSTNLIMAKFYQAKLNVLNVMLSFLGLTSEELQKLQKKALKKAIDENTEFFEQNEYNTEMFTLFGSGRKDKSKQKVFNQIKTQLTQQMQLLGEKNFYSPEKVTSIKMKVVDKIKEDLIQEEQNLMYLRDLQI